MPNAPNTPIQPTPLRGPEIVGVLQSGFVQMAVPIYNGGAADGQPVGPQPLTPYQMRYLL
jgi:hypothetical protein